jgi:hypothetical protein
MPVHIDQTGHQRATLAINKGRAFDGLQRLVADRLDQFNLNQDAALVGKLCRVAVEDPAMDEENLRLLLSGLGYGVAQVLPSLQEQMKSKNW